MKFGSILDLSCEHQLNESGIYTIPGVTYKWIQKPGQILPNLTKQWQVVFVITILPFNTSVLILHYKFVSTRITICGPQGWEFDLQWWPKGGEIDIWKPENVKFPLGCPTLPSWGKPLIGALLLFQEKDNMHNYPHGFQGGLQSKTLRFVSKKIWN